MADPGSLLPSDSPDDPWAEHRARQEAEDKAEAERWGLSPEQLRYARAFDIAPDIYAAMQNVRNFHQYQTAMTQVEVERKAREQAEHEALVERAREKLGS